MGMDVFDEFLEHSREPAGAVPDEEAGAWD